MRVLYLVSKQSDYLQDVLYSGLAEVLGPESVLEYPHRPDYHLSGHPYPRNMGFFPESGVKRRFTDRWFFRFFRRHAFDLVVVASCKPEPMANFLRLAERVPKFPAVFIDGGDYPGIGQDVAHMPLWNRVQKARGGRPFDLVFKRELPENETPQQHVRPISFSINPLAAGKLETDEKKFPLSFCASESSPVRRKAADILSEAYPEHVHLRREKNGHRFKSHEHLARLGQSVMGLSFRGIGFDTLRYWEIPFAGALLISERPLIHIRDNFREGEHAVFCRNDLSDLKDKVDYFVKHTAEAREIASAGRSFYWDRHQPKHRAEYVLEEWRAVRK